MLNTIVGMLLSLTLVAGFPQLPSQAELLQGNLLGICENGHAIVEVFYQVGPTFWYYNITSNDTKVTSEDTKFLLFVLDKDGAFLEIFALVGAEVIKFDSFEQLVEKFPSPCDIVDEWQKVHQYF